MSCERIVKRYSAYYLGWCQAFGEHDPPTEEHGDVTWLVGEDKVGFILSPRLRRVFLKELLATEKQVPEVVLTHDFAQINDTRHELTHAQDRAGLDSLIALLEHTQDIHFFLTYHVVYPSGTRIVTFSKKRPLGIMYKEFGDLRIKVI